MDLLLVDGQELFHYQNTHPRLRKAGSEFNLGLNHRFSRGSYRVAKRAFDLILCLVALPFVLPVLAVCAVLIRLDSPGPAFFIQERIGKDGKRFKLYKLRTMQHNLDDSFHRAFMRAFVNGEIGNAEPAVDDTREAFHKAFVARPSNQEGRKTTTYKPFTDSQVTRAGHILRKTSLDELPQVFNVLKGDMSLVGPRPNVPWEVEAYQDWHCERLAALPGITGLAQVNGRSCINFDTIAKYDIEYVRNRGLMLDLRILTQTVLSVVSGAGAE